MRKSFKAEEKVLFYGTHPAPMSQADPPGSSNIRSAQALKHHMAPTYVRIQNFRDAEARIIRPIGQYQWECELYVMFLSSESLIAIPRPNGVTFVASAGTTEFTKKNGLAISTIVSFKHHGFLLASRKPKLPTLYRVRDDLDWEGVVRNWKEQKVTPSGE